MTPTVVDASAVVEYLRWSPAGARLAKTAFGVEVDRHLPHLCIVEAVNALRSMVIRREMHASRAEAALDDLRDLVATRHPVEPLLPLIWQLRETMTAYDATYVALAEALDAPLVTADRRLAGVVKTVEVDVVQ